MPKKKKTEGTSLALTIAQIEKKFGEGSIMILGESSYPEIKSISTGSIGLDDALGIGGIPRGRITEIYGAESCIAHHSFLSYEVWANGRRINSKGGTIERLYERFHKTQVNGTPNQGRHLQNNNADFYVKSVDDDDRIIRNKVLNIVHVGIKKCSVVTTEKGHTLTATKDHKFKTPNGFVTLSELRVGDTVFVHNNTRIIGRKIYPKRQEVYVKYHPLWPTKNITDGKTEKTYTYYRGQKSRAAYEAQMNGMSYEEYIEVLNKKEKEYIDKMNFLSNDIHVHHIDEDFTNNTISNLQLVSPKEHGHIHAMDRIKNLSFICVPQKIVSIAEDGVVDTYDIKCAYPYNNYIAEKIVVHNSGKTTLALHIIANAQKEGKAAFIDVEHSLDLNYANKVGVDTKNLIVSQPNNGEEALEIAEMLVRSGDIDVIVVDSVAALVPMAEIEGDMADAQIGLQARLMSKALRKLTGTASRSDTAIIFINQIRMKIGMLFGSPETTSGGRALKFYASVRMDIRRIGGIKEGEVMIGNRTRVKVAKNKVAPPFKKVEFDLIFGEGISKVNEVIDLAIEQGIIIKKGSWYSMAGNINEEHLGQGRESVATYLKENPKIFDDLIKQVTEQ